MRHGTLSADAAVELETALRTGPFHDALRAAIAARGLSLQRVQHHLARRGVSVGVTSLSYWQQGARRPQREESLKAVRALEEILRLPPESLIRLLAPVPGGPPRRHAPPRTARRAPEAAGAAGRLIAELGSAPDGGLHILSHHERVRVGAGRELLSRESQLIVRAYEDGVDRFLAVHRGDPGCEPGRMEVRALENCRLGRVLRHEGSGTLVAELLFDMRLRPGDTQLLRYAVRDGTAGPSKEFVRDFPQAGGQYALQVRFTEGALPVRCHRFTQPSAAAVRGGRRRLLLSGSHHSVHLVEPQVRAGLVGIAWDWG